MDENAIIGIRTRKTFPLYIKKGAQHKILSNDNGKRWKSSRSAILILFDSKVSLRCPAGCGSCKPRMEYRSMSRRSSGGSLTARNRGLRSPDIKPNQNRITTCATLPVDVLPVKEPSFRWSFSWTRRGSWGSNLLHTWYARTRCRLYIHCGILLCSISISSIVFLLPENMRPAPESLVTDLSSQRERTRRYKTWITLSA